MDKYKVTPLAFDAKLVEQVIRRRADGESLGAIAKALKTTPGKVAMAELVGTTTRQAIDDPAKLARAVAKDRKAGASWGLLAARYGVTEGTARAAFTAATGKPFSALDYRKVKAVVTAVLALLLLPAMASATTPTTGEIAWASSKAIAYWHVQPPCGTPQITLSPAMPDGSANANPETCQITFNTAEPWDSASVCVAYIHEVGHLVLGVTYFANVNPADPAHSPDRANIMFGGARTLPELEGLERRAGCLPPLVRRHKARKARKAVA
jgi:hypothetical protein